MKRLSAFLGLGALLAALGLGAAWPFCSDGVTYSGDGFNYSLSVADAVTQARQGQFPPLAGASRFALNGRVHPLRTAPYLHYLAIGIDALTARKLALWQLQNASLVFSLLFASFATYVALRRATGCQWEVALLLTATYLYSPSVLGAAYGLDLFMTVHAVPFLPIALAGCLLAARRSSLSAECVQAIGLAGAWWAHPPVALWLTTGVALVRALAWVRRPNLRSMVLGLAGAGIFAALAIFTYVSASSLTVADDGLRMENNDPMASAIVNRVRADFPQMVLPIDRGAEGEWDIQLSYAGYGLLLGSVLWVFWRRSRGSVPDETRERWLAAGLAGFGFLLVVMDLPVPVLTETFWHALPSTYLFLTNSWPMYRLFLVAHAFAAFAGGIAAAGLPRRRLAAALALLLGVAWTGWEGHYFIRRGLGNRTSFATAKAQYYPGNVNLTLTSYSFGVLPPWYVCGPEDGDFMFRLLAPDGSDTSNYDAVEAKGRVILQAPIDRIPTIPGLYKTRVPLVLQPGKRYLASVRYTVPPFRGFVQLIGDHLSRSLPMGDINGPEGFGMGPRQHVSTPVETDKASPETVEFHVLLAAEQPPLSGASIGTMTLKEYQPSDQAIRIGSYVPLRLTVDVPGDGYALATPRMFIPGYTASIDGNPVDPIRSKDYQVAIPVPKGTHAIAIDYVGPLRLRLAYRVSALGWILVGLWVALLPWWDALAWIEIRAESLPWKRIALAGAAAAAIGVPAIWGILARSEIGPAPGAGAALIRLRLPFGGYGPVQPLVSTGRLGAATQVGVVCLDSTHVKLVVDAGSYGRYESAVLACDYSREHTLLVSHSGLYPPDAAAVLSLPSSRREALRHHLAVFWDGQAAVEAPVFANESVEGHVGWAGDDVSAITGATFHGVATEKRRLPVPAFATAADADATLTASFDDRAVGLRQPLLFASNTTATAAVTATAEPNGWVRLEVREGGAATIQSGSFRSAPGSKHTLRVRLGTPSEFGGSVAVDVDGKPLLGGADFKVLDRATFFTTDPEQVTPESPYGFFQGSVLELKPTRPLPPHPLDRGRGPIDLVVRLPQQAPPGLQEPLVTTGIAGKGDSVYVVYADSGHVRIGFDDWGLGGPLSEPIAIDYAKTHSLRILPASLTPGEDTWYAEIDGRRVLEQRLYAHASPAFSPTVGKNLIGFSTSQPQFTGEIYLAARE